MKKNTTLLLIAATIAGLLTATLTIVAPNLLSRQAAVAQSETLPPPPQPLAISGNVNLDLTRIKPGESLSLGVLAPSHSVEYQALMVVANLPCADGKNDNVAGNDAPAIKIVALTQPTNNPNNQKIPLIVDENQDTGFMAANGMCMYHFDTSDFSGNSPCLIVAINDGNRDIIMPIGAKVSWAGGFAPEW